MNHVNQIMPAESCLARREPGSLVSSSAPENLSDREIPVDHPIWDVWDAVRSAYPGPTANWEDIPPIAWAFAVDGLTAEEIAAGVRRMVQDGGTFPPSAPEFRALCRPPEHWEHRRQERAQQDAAARTLTHRPDPEAQLVQIRALREEHGL